MPFAVLRRRADELRPSPDTRRTQADERGRVAQARGRLTSRLYQRRPRFEPPRIYLRLQRPLIPNVVLAPAVKRRRAAAATSPVAEAISPIRFPNALASARVRVTLHSQRRR